ncbi:DUF6538 domain-containing protein [Methylobacterium sp. Leaf89]|uniref:DUF6538 domain-containing protein n=1 Tax=Methylobacterium sp. Leaf89 TaxID=1736245 RepID=UPI0009E8E7A5|nr:DUF6538 domain-containing protein [Methylobacterium sp. Leaf89]
MVLAMARPWRHPKTGMYWFRRRVPRELRSLLGRNEERKTLGTKEPALARTRYLEKAAEVEARWSRLRSGETALEAQPIAGHSTPATCNHDVPAARSFGGWPRRHVAVHSGFSNGAALIYDGTHPLQRPAPWRPVFEAYAAEAKLAPSTIKRWTGVLASLEGVMETDDLARITRHDLIEWKTALLASGRDPRTVRDAYVAAVKAVMNWAVANGRLTTNAAAGVTVLVPSKPQTRDREFTDVEADTILRASLGPHSPRLSREKAASRRWIPWLCAYGGARVNEMTQLRGQDVRLENGIWIVRVTPDAGRVKTGRWRDVPLHLDLVAQGFPDFVRARGHGPLFYDPKRGRGGSAAHPIYKKVGERLASWVRTLGVDDPGVDPNHGWRHRFKTVGRRAGIDPAVLDAIQGHAARTEGEQYGRFPTEALFDAIRRLPTFEMGAAAGWSCEVPSAGGSSVPRRGVPTAAEAIR